MASIAAMRCRNTSRFSTGNMRAASMTIFELGIGQANHVR
jgi:hypothetical protein